jgi:hypothetical protein
MDEGGVCLSLTHFARVSKCNFSEDMTFAMRRNHGLVQILQRSQYPSIPASLVEAAFRQQQDAH